MFFKKFSIRLGMHHSLYLGICIGCIAAACLILGEYYLLSMERSQIIAAALALIGGSLLVMGIIFHSQRSLFSVSDQICSCRYRKGIHTLCVHCGFYPEKEYDQSDNHVSQDDE